jgi:hypothetical protein
MRYFHLQKAIKNNVLPPMQTELAKVVLKTELKVTKEQGAGQTRK